MTNAAIILAAGRGLRAGGGVPKQWRTLAGRPVVDHALAVFRAHSRIDDLILVIGAEDEARLAALSQRDDLTVVTGGSERWLSVLAGLEATQADRVLIHDGARCCVPPQVIDRVLKALDEAPAAAPALAVTDALWSGADGQVTGVRDRTGLYRAQTPQGFRRDALVAAYADQRNGGADDVEIARRAGLPVRIVSGDDRNIKITTPDDFDRARALLETAMPPTIPDIRAGNGFDVHRFGPGDHVMLCGVRVPHDRGLQGHSDADVGLHTVTDAIYGALAQGDIGQHFPPSDPQWKGAESHIFLTHACALARDLGFAIGNVDLTLMCEYPKIGPLAGDMRARLSDIMGLDSDRISVKATTTERLGFTGRGEGIAAMATTTLVKP